jgi:hypothetical protein
MRAQLAVADQQRFRRSNFVDIAFLCSPSLVSFGL